ncbi:MAG: hypothetical protein M5U01_17040 [Ardenticatenaceae bacterium]|nr:hypothetical protein [Ardenticatenaceae bacterium]
MRSLISRLFIPSGLAVGLLILALGLLQGATIWSVAGLAVLAGLSACGWWIARFGPRRVATIRNPQPAARAEPGRSIPKPNWSPRGRAHRLLSALVIAGLLAGVLPPPAPAPAAPAPPMRLQTPPAQPAAQPGGRPHRLPPQGPNQAPGTFWADLDGDRDVDEGDLQSIAQFWNCATGDACYDAALDFNTDGLIDALDMAYVGNEYDVTPPDLTVSGPADGSVVGGATVTVSGVISDKHAVNVTVNGVAATFAPLLAGAGSAARSFSATVPVTAGNQALHVVATDEVGQTTSSDRFVGVDGDGPMIRVQVPENRQSVYTLRPTVVISYTDFYVAVDPTTLQVSLTDASGTSTDVTGDLTAGPDSANGQVSFDLAQDSAYTLTASVADTLGNVGTLRTTFYVPTDPASITPPEAPENAGWVSGVVYDSSTCGGELEHDPIDCQGLAGAEVTLFKIDSATLSQARTQREAQLATAKEPVTYQPTGAQFSNQVQGTVVTGPDGFFAFPADQTARYELRVDKAGYTYGQRVVEVVRERSAPVNEIYLTPLDPAVTTCDEGGCSHTSADGQMQVDIPAGAIRSGDEIPVTATAFDQVNYLPSGGLPPGTWETYGFNIGGTSTYSFTQPITVRIKNSKGFPPGTVIPLGFWNAELLQWEHAGTSVVDPTGEWVEMQVTHFSTFDCNDPVTVGTAGINGNSTTENDRCCSEKKAGSSEIILRSGVMRESVSLPPVRVLGAPGDLSFKYDSGRADPNELIEVDLNLDMSAGAQLGDYVQAELFIEGEKTANFTFAASELVQGGEIGRFRFLWDGRDARGNRLPPGVYRYALHVRVPYMAQYYWSLNNRFGGPPDYTRPTSVFTTATDDQWIYGSVSLIADPGGPFGMGWVLEGMQRLYEDEAGRILIDDGSNDLTEFYFPAKNLLREEAQGGGLAAHEVTGLHGLYVPEVAERVEQLSVSGEQWSVNSEQLAVGGEQWSVNSEQLSVSEERWPVAEEQQEVVSGRPVGEEPREGATTAPGPVDSVTPARPVTAEPAGPVPEATPVLEPEPAGPTPEITPEPEPEPEPLPPPVVYDVTALNTNVAGTIITHTTWTITDSPYILTGDVVITGGVTLTVEPGVVVQGQDNVELKVQGHLQAVGTASQPITFTSATDSGPNQWAGLVFDGGTGELRRVTVRYGGDPNGIVNGSNLTVRNVTAGEVRIESSRLLSESYQYASPTNYGLYVADSRVVVSDTLFANIGNGTGDYALYATGAGTVLTVTNSSFQNNNGWGLYTTGSAAAWVSDSAFSGNGYYPLRTEAFNLHRVLSGNTFTGNTPNRLLTLGSGLPASIIFSAANGLAGYELENDFTVPAGITLTVAPGVPLMGRDSVELKVQGHLQAVGTASQPITFTSATDSGPNQWAGLVFDGGTGELRHATVRYGGDPNGIVNGSNVTVRNVTAGEVRLESSRLLSESYQYAYTNYGLYVADSRVVVSDTLFANIGNNTGDYALYATGAATVLTVTTSTFQDNAGYPLRIPVAALSQLQFNVFIQNGYDRARLYGDDTFTTNLTLAPQNGLSGYEFEGNVTLAAGANLTVAPGTSLYWNPGKRLTVHGLLNAIGTEAQPITFTSSADTGPGQWQGITLGDGAAEIERATIRYANTGLKVQNGQARVRYATIANNSAYGIHLAGSSADFSLHGSDVSGNGSYGLLNQTGVEVDARYNWWGHPSGPYHPSANPGGQGNRVSDDVLFVPWLEQQITDLGIQSQTPADNTELTYDAQTDTYTRHYPDGTQVHFNTDGTHDYTLDPAGNKTAYVYNPDGTPARIEVYAAGEPNPRWVWVFSDQSSVNSDQRILMTDPAGRVTTFEINRHGDLVRVVYPDGATRSFAYDSAHRMTQNRDELSRLTTYVYDAYGRITQVKLPPRPVYDPQTGQMSTVQEVHGYTPSDVAYQLVNEMDTGSPITPTDALITSTKLVDGVVFGRGGYQAHTNEWGSVTEVTDAAGKSTRYERDERNRITRATLPSGRCIEYTYDEKGNRLSESHMGPSQCALAPADRDPAQIQTWTYTYEPRFNQLKSATDPLSNTTRFLYDYDVGGGEAGKLAEVRYPTVADENGTLITPTVRYAYNAWGQMEAITDERGTATRFIYTQGTADEAADGGNPLFAPGVTPVPGLLTKVVEDEAGIAQTTMRKDFDAAGNPRILVGAACCGGQGPETHYAYDAWGRVVSMTDPLSIATRYEYDAAGNLTREIQDYTTDSTTGRNVVTQYTYDSAGNMLGVRTEEGEIVSEIATDYDIDQRPVAFVDALGYRTVSIYDDANQLVGVRDPEGREWSFTYTADRQLETFTDRRGTVMRREYGDFGRLARQIADDGGMNLLAGSGLRLATTYGYDAAGRVTTMTNPLGVITAFEYDALSRVVSEIQDVGGLNRTLASAYDAAGNLRRVTDERGVTTRFVYDALGRQTTITADVGGLNQAISFAYDSHSNLRRVTDPRGVVTSLEYDALNRVTLERLDDGGLGTETRYGYDRLGNLNRITDPNGRVTSIESNAFGLPVRELRDVGGMGAETQYLYDNALRLIGMTSANGETSHYRYDALDQLIAEQYPDGTTVHYAYDGEGNLLTRTNQAGEVVTYTYDALGRQTRRTMPDSSQTYAYDDMGRLVQAASHSGEHDSALNYVYNALGHPVSGTQQLDARSWEMTWDYGYPRGVVTQTYPSGAVRVYQADAVGRLQSLRRGDGASVASYTYDDVNGRYILHHGNGLQTTYIYDNLYRITDINSAVAHYGYSYDAVGNVTSMQRYHVNGAPSDVYQYDGLDQLTRVTYGLSGETADYLLDKLGNRLQVSRNGTAVPYLPNNGSQLTDPMNRYAQVGSVPLNHDLKGNLLGDGAYDYSYDALNRLVEVSESGGKTTEYLYDALDRRIAKVVDGAITHFILDPTDQVLEERDGSDQLLARYTYDWDIDSPLTMERGGDTYYYHTDMLGNVTEVTDDAGTLVERYTYDVYGQVSIFDGSGNPLAESAIDNPYLFAARHFDNESGLYYYRARMYHPSLGRFLQMDPLGYVDGMNLYTYVGNNPVGERDPFGLKRPCRDKRDVADKICSTEWAKELARRLKAKSVQTKDEIKRLKQEYIGDIPLGVTGAAKDVMQWVRTVGPQARYVGQQATKYLGPLIATGGYGLHWMSAGIERSIGAGKTIGGAIMKVAGKLGRGGMAVLKNPLTWKAAAVAGVFIVSFCGTNYLMNKTGLKQTMRDFGEWAYDAGVFVSDVAVETAGNFDRAGRRIGEWYADDYTPWARDAGSFAYDVAVETANNFDRTGRWIGDKAYDAYEATSSAASTAYNATRRGLGAGRGIISSAYNWATSW